MSLLRLRWNEVTMTYRSSPEGERMSKIHTHECTCEHIHAYCMRALFIEKERLCLCWCDDRLIAQAVSQWRVWLLNVYLSLSWCRLTLAWPCTEKYYCSVFQKISAEYVIVPMMIRHFGCSIRHSDSVRKSTTGFVLP